jgi:ATP-dependent Clp endopeptidase proteolytic subunit ClpP
MPFFNNGVYMSLENESDNEDEKSGEENTNTNTEEPETEEPQMTMAELAEMLAEQVAAAEEAEKERNLSDMRTVGLYGDVEEEKVAELIAGLLSLHHLGKPKPAEEGEEQEEGKPIDMYVSTYGGAADDMAAVVDIMNMVKKDCPIRTIGIGKVMSAGVLILASGTPGERVIGRNCRVMIHSVIAGNAGALHNLENKLQEVRKLQESYLDSLERVTKLTKKQLKSFMRRKTNVYLSAEEAIKYGIADKILE